MHDEYFESKTTEDIVIASVSSDSCATTVHKIEKPVPCLKDLCANLVGKIHMEIPLSHVARGVLLGSNIEQNQELSFQMNRLHHLLHFHNDWVHKEKNRQYRYYNPSRAKVGTWYLSKDKNGTWVDRCKFYIPMRNIWEVDNMYDWYHRSLYNVERMGSRTLPIANTLEEPCLNSVDALSGKCRLFLLKQSN